QRAAHHGKAARLQNAVQIDLKMAGVRGRESEGEIGCRSVALEEVLHAAHQVLQGRAGGAGEIGGRADEFIPNRQQIVDALVNQGQRVFEYGTVGDLQDVVW